MESEPVPNSPEQNPERYKLINLSTFSPHLCSPMDLFTFSGDWAENPIAPRRCKRFRIFAKLFRYLEVCVALIFLSWIFSRLPLAVRICADFVRQLLGFLLTPLFGFILCNAIVATLLARPCGFSGHCLAAVDSETELYEELIENSTHQPKLVSEKEPLCSEPDEVVFQDKQIVSDVKSHVAEIDSDISSESDSGLETPKVYKRSQSVKTVKGESPEKSSRKHRRSETEKCNSIDRHRAYPQQSLHYQDDLSSDEFKEKIEAFIAKELRFRREESLEIVIKTIVSSY